MGLMLRRRLLPKVRIVFALALLGSGCASDPVAEQETPTSGQSVDGRSAVQQELETPGEGREPVTFTFEASTDTEVFLELTANFWNVDPDDTILLRPVGTRHSVTLYLGEGQWLYRFRVNGRSAYDPSNPDQIPADGGFVINSRLRVGQQPELTAPLPDDQTGLVEVKTIVSETVDAELPLYVYLPPGYDSSAEYPLLVLLHGHNQGAIEWSQAMEVNRYLDGLIAEGKIEPMVVVMPEGGVSFFREGHEKHLVDEVVPFVEENYSIHSDRSKRAIAGESMGGFGAFHIAWNYPELFGFSVPLMMAGFCADGVCSQDEFEQAFEGAPDVEFSLYVGADDELGFVENQQRVVAMLQSRSISHRSEVLPPSGHRRAGHSVRFIRRILPDVLIEIDRFFDQSE